MLLVKHVTGSINTICMICVKMRATRLFLLLMLIVLLAFTAQVRVERVRALLSEVQDGIGTAMLQKRFANSASRSFVDWLIIPLTWHLTGPL